MAIRPVYVPGLTGNALVMPIEIEFQWFPGFSISQKQKSIAALHSAAAKRNIARVLEISSKSPDKIGVSLSAFNLQFPMRDGRRISVENVFQSSKIFESGGPYLDLLDVSAKEAKTDPRLRSSGPLRGFCLAGNDWPLQPVTAFYDWLYLRSLQSSPELSSLLLEYDGFSDIEFNPNRSLNCQAASAALFVTLVRRGEFDAAMQNQYNFLQRMNRVAK